jgi:hypothetical protein
MKKIAFLFIVCIMSIGITANYYATKVNAFLPVDSNVVKLQDYDIYGDTNPIIIPPSMCFNSVELLLK